MDGGAGAGGTPAGTGGVTGSGGMAGAGGMPDGSAGAGGCQPVCAVPRAICANSTCVECVTSADCATATKPICDTTTNTCVPCTSDDQCVTKLGADPGVCMSHQDGRCATVSETIYVQNDTTICSDTATTDPGFGTAMKPLCSMQPVAGLLSAMASKDLVVVRGKVSSGTWTYAGQGSSVLTIIGQATGVIAGGASPAFSMQNGSVYIRDLELSLSSMGIRASGGQLHLVHALVDNCMGGILIDGAAFDIDNSTITGNSKATFNGLTTWGGILINNPALGGPARLNLITVESNSGGGITCSTAISAATGVLASNNTMGVDINDTCGFSSCGTASTTCGAQ
jgi:hypothetical protein